ncbi:hypothetical protein YDYSY3_59680 [Paenibacillus chitinolyticus]|uniref:hypothetical protein n=1 Tax=Paenibacillus chitinolyticus TaxID=79263 RepID=UPI0026E4ECA5|nr:hypothetical protein [Paenibacillus chitinolyticus]GKS14968.1 hypothetical protein YDYSY3_59680 [Paenibacillus chitinolyticus]
MRRYCLVLLIMVILFLSACQSSEQLKPTKEETIDFDINTAIEMVEKKEKMIIDLALREKVSKLEYKELEKSFTEEFGDHAKDILSILFINNMDSDPESDRYVQQNTLYPTVFHKGIAITNAVIYKSYFENEFFNQTRLSIKEEYVGDDEKLKDWKREYMLTPNKNGEWELNGFSGVMNFLGEDYTMNYLELKR